MRSVNKVLSLGTGKCRARDLSERQGDLFQFIAMQFDEEKFLKAFEIVEDARACSGGTCLYVCGSFGAHVRSQLGIYQRILNARPCDVLTI